MKDSPEITSGNEDNVQKPAMTPLGIKSDLLEEFYKKFYESSPERKIGTTDIENFEKQARIEGKDENQIKVAKMVLLAEIISERKAKLTHEQITFFTGPLNSMFREADKLDADPSFKSAADQIRQDQFLTSKIISIHSNSLTELSTKMMQYYVLFSSMENDFIRNRKAILAKNPKLAENNNFMYDKTLQTLTNMADVYRNKMKALDNEERNLLNKLINKSPLSNQEYDKSIVFLLKLASLDNTHVLALTESASIYQALMSINALKTTTDAELKMGVYSELFQAPMRHRNPMEEIIKDAEIIQRATNSTGAKAVADNVIEESKVAEISPVELAREFLELTKRELDNLNYNFGNNFMLDNSTVRDLVIINNLIMKDKKNTYKIDRETKALISKYAESMEKFSNANYNYYINKNSVNNQKRLEEAFNQLNTIYAIVNTPENRKKLLDLSDTPLFGDFYNDSKKQIQDAIPSIIDATKSGLFTYLRVFDFEEFKKRSIDECKEKYTNDVLSLKSSLAEKNNTIENLTSEILRTLSKLTETNPDSEKSKMEWTKEIEKVKSKINELKDITQKILDARTTVDEIPTTDQPKDLERDVEPPVEPVLEVRANSKNLEEDKVADIEQPFEAQSDQTYEDTAFVDSILDKIVNKILNHSNLGWKESLKLDQIYEISPTQFFQKVAAEYQNLTNMDRENFNNRINTFLEVGLSEMSEDLTFKQEWKNAHQEYLRSIEYEIKSPIAQGVDEPELSYAEIEARYNQQLAKSLEELRLQQEDIERQTDQQSHRADSIAAPKGIQPNKTIPRMSIIAKARALANENKIQDELRRQTEVDVKKVNIPTASTSDRSEVAQVHHQTSQKLYLKLERMKGVAGELDKYNITNFAQEANHVRIDMHTSENTTLEIQATPLPDNKGDIYTIPNNILDEEKKIAIQNICKLAVATGKPGTEFNIPTTNEFQRKVTEDALNDALSKKYPGLHQLGVFKIPETSVCLSLAKHFSETKNYEELANLIHLSLFHEKLGANGMAAYQINPKELSTFRHLISKATHASNGSSPELLKQLDEFDKRYKSSNIPEMTLTENSIRDIPAYKSDLTMFKIAVMAARQASQGEMHKDEMVEQVHKEDTSHTRSNTLK